MIDKSVVENLQKLARLNIDGHAQSSLLKDLQNIVDFKNKLDEIDTEGVEPLYQITNNSLGLRKDVVKNELTVDDAMKNAPNPSNDFFTVPKVK